MSLVNVTESAKEQMIKLVNENDTDAVHLSVKGGGCSGFRYNFGIDSRSNGDDVIFGKAIIDKSSLDIISGSVVDFKKEMIGESFSI